LKYSILPQRLAVCRLAPDTEVKPSWLAGEFSAIVRTRDELSIVCREDLVAKLGANAMAESGWTALKLEGPFPFAMTGVLASFLQPLAEARIPIFAISTFDTDYVLVKHDTVEQAVKVLDAAGHKRTDSREV
jgi:hypothetical protein